MPKKSQMNEYSDICTNYIKKAIRCDGILHVNMFHYFKTPYIICMFLQYFPTLTTLDLIFLSHVVSMIFLLMTSPSSTNKSQIDYLDIIEHGHLYLV
jgi:hypothetical protein